VVVGPADDPFEAARLRTLGRLLPGVLHELANPLLALGGTLELLVEEVEPGTTTARRLELVRHTSDELAGLVRSLQRLARERFEPEREIQLGPFVAETASLVHRFSAAPDAEVDVQTAGAGSVRARPAALRQVLFDALLDALEGAAPGQPVAVRVKGACVSVGDEAVDLPASV
jgi:two-component system sensor histidine kinase PilS (NtrC family)